MKFLPFGKTDLSRKDERLGWELESIWSLLPEIELGNCGKRISGLEKPELESHTPFIADFYEFRGLPRDIDRELRYFNSLDNPYMVFGEKVRYRSSAIGQLTLSTGHGTKELSLSMDRNLIGENLPEVLYFMYRPQIDRRNGGVLPYDQEAFESIRAEKLAEMEVLRSRGFVERRTEEVDGFLEDLDGPLTDVKTNGLLD